MGAKFFCENCGTLVDESHDSCPSCGLTFNAVRCPSCGFIGRQEDFKLGCPSCGFLTPKREEALKKPKQPYRNKEKASRRRRLYFDDTKEKREVTALPGWFYPLLALALVIIIIALAFIYIRM